VFERSLKESERKSSSGGIVPFVHRGNRPREKFIQSEGGEAGEFFKRKRIDDLKLSSRSPKSRRPSDRGGVARELTRRCTEESVCHCISAYRGWRVQELHARRNRESRFPDLIGAVDHRRDRWHEIPRSRDSALRRFQSRKEHGEIAKSRVATGPTETEWRTTRGIAHRHSGF
jgi:hypothetical protein